MGHRPPPCVAPRPPLQPFCLCLCGPVRGCGRDRHAAQPAASSAPDQVCPGPEGRDPATPSGASAEKNPKLLLSRGFRAEASAPDPRSPRPGPGALTDVSILIVVLLQLHVQQDVPSHHLHVSPRLALDWRSAPLGAARLCSARAASSAQPCRRSLLHYARALLP